MEELMILRAFAAVTTVLAASLVAANLNASKASLVIQNVILLMINVVGVWRWLPKAGKEAKR